MESDIITLDSEQKIVLDCYNNFCAKLSKMQEHNQIDNLAQLQIQQHFIDTMLELAL